MENSITIEELYAYAEAKERLEHRRNRFTAAMQGVDIEDNSSNEDFEKIKARADAALAGKTEEMHAFDIIGIEYDADDDDE